MQSDTDVWQAWLDWLPSAPSMDRPQPVFAAFRAHLSAQGADAAEIERRMGVVLRMMRTETGGWQIWFNNIYTAPVPGFSTAPNAFLASSVAGRRPGRALDIATGQGRNAVFLAVNGWDVTAIDVSDAGLAIAERNAASAGVALRTVQTSHASFDLGVAQWALIVLTYVPVQLTAPDYSRRLIEALTPGGLLIVESFASDAAAQGRRPVDIDPAELGPAFAELRIVAFEDLDTVSDWEPTPTRVVRFAAERPAPA